MDIENAIRNNYDNDIDAAIAIAAVTADAFIKYDTEKLKEELKKEVEKAKDKVKNMSFE